MELFKHMYFRKTKQLKIPYSKLKMCIPGKYLNVELKLDELEKIK